MGNTTASLTHEQLFGGGNNRENRPRHQTGRALYRNLHDAAKRQRAAARRAGQPLTRKATLQGRRTRRS